MGKEILEKIAQDLATNKLTPGGAMIAKRLKDLYAQIGFLEKVGEELNKQADESKKELTKTKLEVAQLEKDYEKLKG